MLADGLSSRIKRRLQPLDAGGLHGHHVKAASRRFAKPHQIVARRKNDTPLLQGADAGSSATVASAAAPAHLYKHQRAITRSHDQVNFAAATSRGPIIALKKAQAARTQVRERSVFCRVAELLGGTRAGLDLRKNH